MITVSGISSTVSIRSLLIVSVVPFILVTSIICSPLSLPLPEMTGKWVTTGHPFRSVSFTGPAEDQIHAAGLLQNTFIYYRFRFTNSSSMESDVVIIREFA